MKTFLSLLSLVFLTDAAVAGVPMKVDFTLKTTDPQGAPLVENRIYWVYRPANLPRATPAPVLLIMGGGPENFFNAKADQMGIVVVTCSFSGNSTGTPARGWKNDNSRSGGPEDYDYISEVIHRVKTSENCHDVFMTGFSAGGHTSLAYACERPSTITAASAIDEFMGLTNNIPTGPVPMIILEGAADGSVPYTMVKDTVDAWRKMNGLLQVAPVTTDESSPLLPGNVSEATWRGGAGEPQVALVTIVGGNHTIPNPQAQTGCNAADILWAFFSQYLTSAEAAPKIVSPPVNNVQFSGQPASFHVVATGRRPLSYQWKRNGVDIPGATGSEYTTPPTTAASNAASFSVKVSNGIGNGLLTAPASLTVEAAPRGPAITTHPLDQTVTAGRSVTFTVKAGGTGTLGYQWQKNGNDLPGATTAALVIPAAIGPDCGATFRVVVTDGSGSSTSRRATLTVNPATGAPVITADVARVRVLAGERATFSITAKDATSYQWQKGAIVGGMTDIPGATDPTFTLPAVAIGDHRTPYRCTATNAAGSATSASELLFVTSRATAPTGFKSPAVATAEAGKVFTYTIVAAGGTAPLTFTASPLPAGLAMDSGTGVISGTPTQVGVTNVTTIVSNGAGSKSAALVLTVKPPTR